LGSLPLANQEYFDDYRWADWGPPRRWPTSSLSWRRLARIGSTAETYRSMGWSNPMLPSIGGHFGHVRQGGVVSRLAKVAISWRRQWKLSAVGAAGCSDRRDGGLCCGRRAAIKPCAFGAPLRGCGA